MQSSLLKTIEYKVILDKVLNQFRTLFPRFNALVEGDPAYQLLKLIAYREMTFTRWINSIIRDEKLTTHRRAVSPAGTIEHYKNHVFQNFDTIRGIHVERNPQYIGQLDFYLLEDHQGTVSKKVQSEVERLLNADHVKCLNDTIKVFSPNLVEVNIDAKIWLKPDAPIDKVNNLLDSTKDGELTPGLIRAEYNQFAGLGTDINLSWLYKLFHRGFVSKVELVSPKANLIIPNNTYPLLKDLKITFIKPGNEIN